MFTVGHSSHPLQAFVTMLKEHEITHRVDIRSIPYSSNCPWFQRDALARTLRDLRIDYRYLEDKLGGPHLVCLMCAEEDPDHCHRKVMLRPSLRAAQIDVLHIRADRPLTSEEQVHKGEAGPHH